MPIVRLLPDGLSDPTLDGDGRVTIELSEGAGQGAGNLAEASSLASEADGRIVVVGNGNSSIWNYDADTSLIARVNSDGSPDTTFGDGGTAWIDLHGAYLQGIVTQSAGPIYLAGDYRGDHFVARLTWDGILDASFGVDGVAIIDSGDGNGAPNAGSASLIRQSDGKIVTVSSTSEANSGWTDDYGTERLVIARLLVGDESGQPGLLGFYGLIVDGSEGEVVQVPVRRTGGSSGSVGVDYATQPDSASSGEDFTAASGTLTWSDGDVADKLIEVRIAADSTTESSETFRVELSQPSGGATLASRTVVVAIEGSNPAPPPSPPPTTSGGGGGGGLDWWSLACLIAFLPTTVWRVRRRICAAQPQVAARRAFWRPPCRAELADSRLESQLRPVSRKSPRGRAVCISCPLHIRRYGDVALIRAENA